jgi:DNA-binding NtrC family response regulator
MTNSPESPTFLPYAEHLFDGASPSVARLRLQAERIAPHFRLALITGEAGSGKKRLAIELHRLGPNPQSPYVFRSAAAFAEGVFDPTVEPSASTLFLYGVESLSIAQQAQLIDCLTAPRFPGSRRVGDPPSAIERIILGCNRDLRSLVAAGRMRLEFQSKFGTLELRVPPLRERMGDLEALTAGMLHAMNARGSLGGSALETLRTHGWPGNLRELWELLTQVRDRDGTLAAADLPRFAVEPVDDQPVRLDDVMQRHVIDVLQRCAGNKVRAAEMLGISRSTLYRMLESIAA